MGTMIILNYKGSATSGNRGHAGRPGKVGGSTPKSTTPITANVDPFAWQQALNIGLYDKIVNVSHGNVLRDTIENAPYNTPTYDSFAKQFELNDNDKILPKPKKSNGARETERATLENALYHIAALTADGHTGTAVEAPTLRARMKISDVALDYGVYDKGLDKVTRWERHANLDQFRINSGWNFDAKLGIVSDTMARNIALKEAGYANIKQLWDDMVALQPTTTKEHTIILGVKGSATSGNRMHAGRPGKIGGSMPRNFAAAQQAQADIQAQANLYWDAGIMANIDLTTLNRAGLQAIIDYRDGIIYGKQALSIVTAPTSARASGTYTSAAATAARAAGQPMADLTEDIDWTTTGLAVPNRSTPGTPWVSNAEDAWILGIDKTNLAGKQAIAYYTAGYITKETLHERLSPAYRDMNLGFAIPGIENAARDQGKADFNGLFAAKINGTAQRRSYIKEEAWVSQIKLSELNDNQWKAFSEYRQGLITLDDLRKIVAPHTLLPTTVPKAVKAPKVGNDKTTQAKYYNPDDLPSMKGFSNGSMYISSSAKNGGDGYLDAIVKDQGFDGKPQVITRAQFDAAVAAGEVAIYRGTSSSAASRVQRYKDFRTGEYYSGFGMYGHGTYTSTVQSTARSYDGGEYNQSSRILAMTIKPDAKVIEYSDASQQKEHYVARQTRNSMIADDDGSIGRWAAAAGYDVIRVPNADRNNGDFYVVLNRTAVRVVNVDFSLKDDTTF